jgi:DNA-binding transcriptional LysR family regulator
MFVRQLSYLVTLAREKHFARAAEKCNVTQSTLSAGLKALERELDMRLVIREPRFMGLTPEGERAVEWAAQIIIDYDSLKQEVEGLREGLKGTLRLGVIPAAMPALARLTAAFCAKHPHVSVDVNSMTSIDIQNGLDKFELDAGLTYLDNEPLVNVRKRQLYKEKYMFVTSAHGPFAKLQNITWHDAASENLCLLHEGMQNRRVLNNIARSAGLKLAPTVTTNSFLAVCSYVCSGVWSSIIPHTFSYLFSECKDLILIDLIEPVHAQSIGLVASDRDPMPPLAHALMQCATRLDFEGQLVPANMTTV